MHLCIPNDKTPSPLVNYFLQIFTIPSGGIGASDRPGDLRRAIAYLTMVPALKPEF
ncbi:MAG: hypothetical protein ABI180_16640 [Microcoleus sp.]